jgi:uncharacterized protein (DUF1330 family)
VAGYVIAIVDVTNAEGYQEYSKHVPATIAKYGGRYLVRGGRMEAREGEWPGPPGALDRSARFLRGSR